MVRLVCRHLAADERFARRYRNEHSPEIPLTLPFSSIFQGFFRALLLLKPLPRSRSVAGVHVCVCGCVLCMLCAVLCYICSKNMRKSINMENKNRLTSWSQRGEKMQKKNTRNIGNISKHGLPFMAQKGPKTAIFPDALFLRFPWDLPTFSAEGPIPNTKKRRF